MDDATRDIGIHPTAGGLGISPGQIIDGKYHVDRILGQGGMGVVVSAFHLQLETKVAIKFLRPEMLQHHEIVARFEREAKAAVRMTNEHVARIFDVGTMPSGEPYMVMEYLDGGDLASWLHERGALPVAQAVDFVLQASVAIAEAHSLGIVHRDLKPANLFCVRRADGQTTVKVLDFGISKVLEADGVSSLTKTTSVLGTPYYMSPEQMKSSRTADPQSDIWALGVILYELLANRVPFAGETMSEVAVAVSMQEPPPLRSYRPDVPQKLEAVVLGCLEKSRAKRYRSVGELAVALGEFAPSAARVSVDRISNTLQASRLSATDLGSVASIALAAPAEREAVKAPSTDSAMSVAELPGRHARPSRARFVAVLGGVALLGTGLAGLGLAHRGEAPSAPAAAVSEATATDAAAPIAPTSLPSATGKEPAVLASAGAASPHRESADQQLPSAKSPTNRMPRAAPIPVPASRGAPVSPPRKPSACDPPYTVDSEGHRHFKRECYLP